MPRISEELRNQIRQSLILKYQQQFGANYMQSFHKNLIPNPVPELAQQFGVSQYAVTQIHTRIKNVGYLTRTLT